MPFYLIFAMQTTDVSLLEQIANEFNSGESARNPHELLGLMNQYYIANSKSPLAHLDDINKGHATRGLGGILGFKLNNPRQMGQRLVELGIFSQRLSDYSPELLEKIIGKVIGNVSTHNFSSFYMAEDNKYAEANKKVIATSPQMKDYLSGKGIAHLDDINAGNATRGLGGILGFNSGNPRQMGQRLAKLGIFSQRLSDYSPELLEKIIGNVSNPRFSSFYLAEDNEYAKENRKVIATSPQMKDYLASKGIAHLDDVNSGHATGGLGGILGFKEGNPRQMGQRLVELGVFPTDLSDSFYDNVRERICENFVNKIGISQFSSFYTSADLDSTILESNRRAILASKAVQNFFSEQGYNMNDSRTMTKDVELFLNKYFRTKNIEEILKPQERSEIPNYRRIHKEWNLEEEKVLQNAYERFGGDEDNFRIMLNLNKTNLQELFGVSYSAIINKCQRMGFMSTNGYGGSKETGTPKYAFPSIHAEEFPDFVKGFENYATLLTKGLVPAATPAFAFESAVHEQFYHATLPVHYKGVDVEKYNPAEQAVINAAWHYISDNAGFDRKQNGDMTISPSTEQGLDPVILQIEGNPNPFVQLIFRRNFNPDNIILTTAIELGGLNPKSELYFFKHEKLPTYQNTRV